MSEKTIFKANPYNLSNKLLNIDDINDIMKLVNITDFKIKNLELYQRAFIHKSYCNMKQYEEFSNDISALPLFQESYEKIEFLLFLPSQFSSICFDNIKYLLKLKFFANSHNIFPQTNLFFNFVKNPSSLL